MTSTPHLEEDFYPPYAIHTMALSADGKQLALGTAGGAVMVVELEDV